MKTTTLTFLRTLMPGVLALLLASAPAHAQSNDPNDTAAAAAKEMDEAALKQGDAKVISQLTADFKKLAGSEENATALVTGLRDGTSVKLTSTVNGQAQTATFTPPTGKLGYGNAYLALALAQAELTKAGIASPTPEQLQTALNGGSLTVGDKTIAFAGVLKLRADGQGWGQIAQTLDVRLGTVVSGIRSARGQIERADRPQKSDKAERPAMPEKANRPETPGRPEMPERAVRPEMPERVQRPDRAGR
jgi:hypothetical protein